MGWGAGPFPIPDNAGGAFLNHSGVPHRERKLLDRPGGVTVVDGYREDYADDDAEATILFDTPWTARGAFLEWVLGYVTNERSDAGGLTGRMKRVIPDQHPEMPWLYARDARLIQGLGAWVNSPNSHARGADGGLLGENLDETPLIPMPAYADNQGDRHADGKARYAVTYRPVDYQVRTDEEMGQLQNGKGELERFVRRERSWAVQAVPINRVVGVQLKFLPQPAAPAGVAGTVVQEGGLLLFPTAQLVYTWRLVADVPYAAVDACLGKVNSHAFDGARGGYGPFPAETLLCQPPTVTRKTSRTGRVVFDVVYRFDYRPLGWNVFPAADANFYPATLGGLAADPKVFKSADFDRLFVPPPPVQYQ